MPPPPAPFLTLSPSISLPLTSLFAHVTLASINPDPFLFHVIHLSADPISAIITTTTMKTTFSKLLFFSQKQ
uniref:Uncharacterized protein n=1 Tax=Medicago truncatula TaxID=3880 RepID=I3SWW0_MEDTR|nr:unknown [Medicago truncatula]